MAASCQGAEELLLVNSAFNYAWLHAKSWQNGFLLQVDLTEGIEKLTG